jgi:PII interaction protein X
MTKPATIIQPRTNHETYLNHPTFGLLFRVCLLDENRELFATLYAQRLFFLVTSSPEGIRFDPLGRTDAKILVEGRMRHLRRNSQQLEHEQLQTIHKQTFH